MSVNVATLTAKLTADISDFVSKMDTAKSKGDGLAGALKVAGVGLAAAGAVAGGALAAGLGVAVTAASGFEQTMSGVKAVSGATADELNQLSALALRLGKDTAFSADEAGKGLEELVKGGVSIPDILGGAAEATLNLAAAGGVELPRAAEIAANAMNQFGLKGSDMARVADLVAGAANASSLDVNDFALSLQQVGAVANTVGQSFDSTAAAIAIMGAAGIKGSDAGTSLKTMLLNLQPKTKEQTDLFRKLGIITEDGANRFFDASGKAKDFAGIAEVLRESLAGMTEQQKIATLETMFGSDAIRAGAILANAGAEGFDRMATSMSKVTAAEVGKTRLDNLRGSLEQLKGSLETGAIILGSKFTPKLKELVDGVTGLVNKGIDAIPVFEKFFEFLGGPSVDSLNELAIAVAKTFGLDAVGPVTEFAKQINNIGGAFNALSNIFAGGDKEGGMLQLATILNQMFGPEVEQRVIGITQGIADLIDKVGGIKKAFEQGGIAGVIAQEFGGEALAAWFRFSDTVTGLQDRFKEARDALGGFFGTIGENGIALGLLKGGLEAAALALGILTAATILQNLWNGVLTVSTNLLTGAKRALAFVTQTAAGKMGLLGLAVFGAVEVLGELYNRNETVNQTLKDLSPTLQQSTGELSGMEVAAALTGDAFSILGGNADLLRIIVGNAFSALGTAANSMVTAVGNAFSAIGFAAHQAMLSVVESVNGIIRGINSLPGVVRVPEIQGPRISLTSNVGEYAEGGLVPGPIGAAQLAIVHGGEYVIPAAQVSGFLAGRSTSGSATPAAGAVTADPEIKSLLRELITATRNPKLVMPEDEILAVIDSAHQRRSFG